MTGRTHDLAAFTALSIAISTVHIPQISIATALIAFGANMIGGLAPDIDQPSAELYRKIRGGKIISMIINPLLGSHRFLSHSFLGVVIFGVVAHFFLQAASSVILVNMNVVWWAFMLGFSSHLVMDTFTKEGVPWFFPITLRIGFPPFRLFRIKTGGFVEKSFVFPGLLLVNVYFVYTHYDRFVALFRQLA
jgi:inner membrane protein